VDVKHLDADDRFTKKWIYRLGLGGLANGGRFDGTWKKVE